MIFVPGFLDISKVRIFFDYFQDPRAIATSNNEHRSLFGPSRTEYFGVISEQRRPDDFLALQNRIIFNLQEPFAFQNFPEDFSISRNFEHFWSSKGHCKEIHYSKRTESERLYSLASHHWLNKTSYMLQPFIHKKRHFRRKQWKQKRSSMHCLIVSSWETNCDEKPGLPIRSFGGPAKAHRT